MENSETSGVLAEPPGALPEPFGELKKTFGALPALGAWVLEKGFFTGPVSAGPPPPSADQRPAEVTS